MPESKSVYEWLHDQIRYERDREKLRSYTISLLVIASSNMSRIDDVFRDEYDDAEDYDPASWLEKGEDRDSYDLAVLLREQDAKNKLGRNE